MLRTPLRFFEESENTAARNTTVFHTVLAIIATHVLSFCPQVISGQVTRSGQVTLPPKSFFYATVAQFLSDHMKLSGYNEIISSYKTYIFDF